MRILSSSYNYNKINFQNLNIIDLLRSSGESLTVWDVWYVKPSVPVCIVNMGMMMPHSLS